MRKPRFLLLILLTLVSGSLDARQRSAPASPVREIEGTVKTISASQLVVTDEHSNDVTLTINSDTIFRSGDMAIAPGDVKAGDRVEVKAAISGTTLTAILVKLQNDEPQEPHTLELRGSIKSVSPNEIVITDAQQHDTTVELTSTTMIRKGDQAITSADLAIGDRVEVTAMQSGTMLNALLVKVEENEEPQQPLIEVTGTIKSISSTQIVVTDSQQHDTTFQIVATTVIRKGDQSATPADLAVGDRVEVLGMANGATNTAVAIHADAPEMEEDVEVSGVVKSLGANSLVLTTRSGDVTVNVDANTRIRKDDHTIVLTDIKVGDPLKAEGMRVDPTTILAREIEVQSSSSGGHH